MGIREFAPGGNQLGLLGVELRLQLGAESNERLGFAKLDFEFSNMAGVVSAFGF